MKVKAMLDYCRIEWRDVDMEVQIRQVSDRIIDQ